MEIRHFRRKRNRQTSPAAPLPVPRTKDDPPSVFGRLWEKPGFDNALMGLLKDPFETSRLPQEVRRPHPVPGTCGTMFRTAAVLGPIPHPRGPCGREIQPELLETSTGGQSGLEA